MGNLNNKVNLIVEEVSKGMINENSLVGILSNDSDFCQNEDMYREDTLALGFESEAHRVSKEIFDEFKDEEEEDVRINDMVNELWNVNNFISNDTHYGDSTFRITETEFTYVISIAFIN